MPKLGFLKLALALWLLVWLATFSIVMPVANAKRAQDSAMQNRN
jgi:hypothetical protein